MFKYYLINGDYMLNAKRFINGSPEQGELLPTYPSDLVPEDYPARVLNEIVNLVTNVQIGNPLGFKSLI